MVGRKGWGIWVPLRDGDGILDAEELKSKDCSVADLGGYDVPDKNTPSTGATYKDYWTKKYKISEFHDIDYIYTDEDGNVVERFTQALDPTKADTDGDGVSDGDEIRDNSGDWPDVIPASNYNPNEATDPLDSKSYNPEEVKSVQVIK